MNFGAISLTENPAPWVIYAMLITAFGVTMWGYRRSWARTVWSLVLAALVAATCWVILEQTWKPFPDRVPWQIYVAGGVAATALFGTVLQRGRRKLLALMTLLALPGAWGVFNLEFQEYPTVHSLDPRPIVQKMDYATFQQLSAPPEIEGREVGALVTVDLEATQFTHRPALAYIPPAYFTQPELQLPVVVMLAGNPGAPSQWFDPGEATRTLEDFQAAHDGVSPILVSVDGTGSMTANPICVDGPTEKVQTYLAVDVPAQLKKKFRVQPDQQKWTIGGLSYGGTCALQVVTNAPDAYGTFLNFSGQKEPTVGDHVKTVQQFFGGDEEQFRAVNPADLLRNSDGLYSHLQGRFVAGEKDLHSREDLSYLHKLASEAGIDSTYEEVPGGHSYQVWRVALRNNMDFVAKRGGLL